MKFLEEFGFSDLQRVSAEISELDVRLNKEEIEMNADQEKGESKPEEDKGAGANDGSGPIARGAHRVVGLSSTVAIDPTLLIVVGF